MAGDESKATVMCRLGGQQWSAVTVVDRRPGHHLVHRQGNPGATKWVPDADVVVTPPQDEIEVLCCLPATASQEDLVGRRTVKNIESVAFGRHRIPAWYFSPYPDDEGYGSARQAEVLHICEWCLRPLRSESVWRRHVARCPLAHPPGVEIYRDGQLSLFEVDGHQETPYCQSLCLLAKLFLEQKGLYYDVAPFLFYVLTRRDEQTLGCHFVGYFSKEKVTRHQNNVSCLLVLPPYQKHGYGHLLIEVSYFMSRQHTLCGRPERPLSSLGLRAYMKYWTWALTNALRDEVAQKGGSTVTDLSIATAIHPQDVVVALCALGILQDTDVGLHVFTETPTPPLDPPLRLKPDNVRWAPTTP